MYEFLALQPPTKNPKQVQRKKKKKKNYYRNVRDHAFRKAWKEDAMIKIH